MHHHAIAFKSMDEKHAVVRRLQNMKFESGAIG
jgi:hypothetical protein